MTRPSSDIPLVCSLTDAEFRKREATLLAEFKSMIIATTELPEGYAFHIPADRQALGVVVEGVNQ
jgi:hypothetical protein